MHIKTMRELFINELADTYNSETQLVEALEKLSDAATDPNLSAAFLSHLTETKTQVSRLEEIFKILGEKIRKEKCEATVGLLKEADEFMHHIKKGNLLDVAIITAAQKVEHYEIANYGSLRALATQLGETRIAEILETTLAEEKASNEKLTELALNSINSKGSTETEEDRQRLAS